MDKARQASLTRWGLKAEQIAVDHMSKQDLGWKALNPQYLAAKIRKGQSELTLIATSSYFQSITSWVSGDTALAGVKRGVLDENGVEVANIAKIHEFGAGARPLWQPTFKETMAWHYKENTPAMLFMEQIKKQGV